MVQHVVYRDEWEGHNGDEVADRQWRAGLRHHEQSPDRRMPRTRLAASLQEFKSMFKRLAALEESSCAQAETVREQAETIRLQAEALESTRADMRELRREIDQLRRAQASAASQAVADAPPVAPTQCAASARGLVAPSVAAAFELCDADADGTLEPSELRHALRLYGIDARGADEDAILHEYNDGGVIDVVEFARLVRELQAVARQAARHEADLVRLRDALSAQSMRPGGRACLACDARVIVHDEAGRTHVVTLPSHLPGGLERAAAERPKSPERLASAGSQRNSDARPPPVLTAHSLESPTSQTPPSPATSARVAPTSPHAGTLMVTDAAGRQRVVHAIGHADGAVPPTPSGGSARNTPRSPGRRCGGGQASPPDAAAATALSPKQIGGMLDELRARADTLDRHLRARPTGTLPVGMHELALRLRSDAEALRARAKAMGAAEPADSGKDEPLSARRQLVAQVDALVSRAGAQARAVAAGRRGSSREPAGGVD